MNAVDEFLPTKSRDPGLVRAATSANLGDNDQSLCVRVQRTADDLIGNMRAIEIAGVDMVHASSYCFAKHSNGRIGIARWSPHAWTGELHRAVAHAVHSHRSVGKRETAAERGFIMTC